MKRVNKAADTIVQALETLNKAYYHMLEATKYIHTLLHVFRNTENLEQARRQEHVQLTYDVTRGHLEKAKTELHKLEKLFNTLSKTYHPGTRPRVMPGLVVFTPALAMWEPIFKTMAHHIHVDANKLDTVIEMIDEAFTTTNRDIAVTKLIRALEWLRQELETVISDATEGLRIAILKMPELLEQSEPAPA